VTQLLKYGADPTIQDTRKRIPADMTSEDGIRVLLGA